MNQVIVISGGSRGLGQAFTTHLLDQGHTVATFSRRRTEFVTSLESSAEYADRFVFNELDITDASGVGAFVRSVVRRFGRLDALVNNAGVARDGVLATAPHADLQAMLDVNLGGALTLTRACLRPMLQARSGRIVQISSIIGQRGYRGLAAYAATKAGLDGLTRALARECGGHGVTVNSIAPGYIETEMSQELDATQRDQIVRRTPVGRLGTAADVVAVLDFLLSPQAAFITGQVIVVDGGITV